MLETDFAAASDETKNRGGVNHRGRWWIPVAV